jgi:hypothetical protein
MMPAALVTQAARCADGRAWQSAEVAELTGPGTGTGGRPGSLACQAVIRDAAALGSLDHDDATGQCHDVVSPAVSGAKMRGDITPPP